ncbi:TRAP transporter large permease [Bauldia sp.]|uniref:TRAP transporter large permease n=1 Tax=Bauldia sp. TaxID=2575872 RepID=UPI003BA957C3
MIDSVLIGIIGLAVLIGLIVVRIPIAYAMIVVGFVGASVLSGPQIILFQLKDLAYAQFSIYDLSVIPMFVLMGSLASRSGLSGDLFQGARAWIGRFRGGVAMATVLACGGFGAVCGSSLATASTMGRVALPQLARLNYAPALATGTVAAGGVLGILIPPSVVLIIYAIIVEANVVTLFAAALVPGLIAIAMFVATIALIVRVRPSAGPRGEPVTAAEFRNATLGLLPVVAIFGVVVGGIYAGFYNPTPAAAIGVMLVAIHGFALRRLSRKDCVDALLETARLTGFIYLILFGAELLSIFMARAGVPQATAEWLQASGLTPMAIMILIVVVLVLLGMVMDSLSMVILAIPFFWPVIVDLDFGMSVDDLKIWFGIIALIVVELGLITPPVGLNVLIIHSLSSDVPLKEAFYGVMPFFGAEIIRVALLMALPALTLWLPHLLSG